MADDEIVDDQWQSPHRYGSSIYDIFRPRPGMQRELQQNLYASGYMGDIPGKITEGRSPFGRMLQGMGILGEPDARPMTPYEQMLVEEGRHQRGSEDNQTEVQRMQKVKSQLDLAQDVIGSGGGMPDESMGIPEEMQGNVRNIYSTFNQEQAVKDRHNQLAIQGQEADIAYKKAMTDQGNIQKQLLNDSREIQDMSNIAKKPQIKPLYDQYQILYTQAAQAAQAGDKTTASMIMQMMTRLKEHIRVEIVNSGGGKYADRMLPTEDDFLSPFQQPGPNKNIIQTPGDVDNQLQQNMGWPPNRPAE